MAKHKEHKLGLSKQQSLAFQRLEDAVTREVLYVVVLAVARRSLVVFGTFTVGLSTRRPEV